MDSLNSLSLLSDEGQVANAYRSIVQNDQTNDDGTEEQVKCDCKGQCARRSGKVACKCREGNRKCDDLCSCNKTKCKTKSNPDEAANVAGQTQTAVVPDGDLRFEQELQIAENEIKEFIVTLDSETKDKVLIKMLSMGRGSLNFAKKLTTEDPPDPEEPDEDSPQWCKCCVCRPMPDEQESVCCKRVTCITTYTAFSNICLDRHILEVCIKIRCDIRADEFNFSLESFRKAGYCQVALWQYGKLGRDSRRVIPACAIRRIRAQYPAPDGRYMGFQTS